MRRRSRVLLGIAFLIIASLPASLVAESERGPYARIAVLRPNDGDAVDWEAGYIRHLEWHRQAKDSWAWYGWSVWAGERQKWFVYATFGHTAASLDNPVPPAEDERDTISNVSPHVQYMGNALYEYLPELSRGNGEPQPTPRLELTTVELVPGTEKAFEAELKARQPALRDETLWYRMVAGGNAPRYVRLRARPSLSALLDDFAGQALPPKATNLTTRQAVEILTLRPALCYGITPVQH